MRENFNRPARKRFQMSRRLQICLVKCDKIHHQISKTEVDRKRSLPSAKSSDREDELKRVGARIVAKKPRNNTAFKKQPIIYLHNIAIKDDNDLIESDKLCDDTDVDADYSSDKSESESSEISDILLSKVSNSPSKSNHDKKCQQTSKKRFQMSRHLQVSLVKCDKNSHQISKKEVDRRRLPSVKLSGSEDEIKRVGARIGGKKSRNTSVKKQPTINVLRNITTEDDDDDVDDVTETDKLRDVDADYSPESSEFSDGSLSESSNSSIIKKCYKTHKQASKNEVGRRSLSASSSGTEDELKSVGARLAAKKLRNNTPKKKPNVYDLHNTATEDEDDLTESEELGFDTAVDTDYSSDNSESESSETTDVSLLGLSSLSSKRKHDKKSHQISRKEVDRRGRLSSARSSDREYEIKRAGARVSEKKPRNNTDVKKQPNTNNLYNTATKDDDVTESDEVEVFDDTDADSDYSPDISGSEDSYVPSYSALSNLSSGFENLTPRSKRKRQDKQKRKKTKPSI